MVLPHPLSKQRYYIRYHQSSFALVITLALLAVLVLIVVMFVSMAQLDRTATASYSKSMGADQMARASLNLVVAQLQAEMSKDAPPDTNTGAASGSYFTNSTVYTNVTSGNILPQGIGTNTDIPSMVKMSTNAPFFTGIQATSQLQASTNSTTTPSQNGRSVSLNRWQNSYFGTFSATNEAPYWVIMTRSGATNAAGIAFGATGNTINNASAANANYAIGRFAYAIYNEGSLLDVTAAGAPQGPPNGITLTTAQQDLIKGMLAGADLSQVSGITTNTLTQWRNPTGGSGASTKTYTNSLIGYPLTNAAGSVYPGDTTFLSRQDLINAALANQAGLTPAALTNLTTFTRELNQPSWAPTLPLPSSSYAGSSTFASKYAQYAANATAVTTTPFSAALPNPNPLVPLIRVAKPNGSYLAYHDDGTSYLDPISAGDPVMHRRFSLARLAWLGPSGPATINGTPVSSAAIQACFGLVYAPNNAHSLDSANIPSGVNVWQYVGPTGTTEQSNIKTLAEVALENPPREPNFFELLQAGILNGSLATDGGPSSNVGSSVTPLFPDLAQKFPPFQILRIGANIICQYNTDQYPRLIEYTPDGVSTWLAAGIQNLPYLNSFFPVMGQSDQDPNQSDYTQAMHYIALEFLFGLWNPHQQNPGITYQRPAIRLCVETGPMANPGIGCRSLYYGSGYSLATTGAVGGYMVKIPVRSSYVQLVSGTANAGVQGFLNPGLLTSGDIASPVPSTFSSGGLNCLNFLSPPGAWQVLPLTNQTGPFVTLETYRMPDLQVNLSQNNIADNANPYCSNVQPVLEYNDDPTGGTSGNWIPYDYWVGINDTHSWQAGTYGCVSISLSGSTNGPPYGGRSTNIPPATLGRNLLDYPVNTLDNRHPEGNFLTSDPRTFRFNPWEMNFPLGVYPQKGGASAVAYDPRDSLWSGLNIYESTALSTTSSGFAAAGYGGGNQHPLIPAGSPGGAPTGSAWGMYYPSTLNPYSANWYYPAVLCRNNTVPTDNLTSCYLDPDGVQRIGDSGMFTNLGTVVGTTAQAPNVGNPYWTSGTPSVYAPKQIVTDRPIILNRAFNHVADLGYTFRDDPWRSLDFFSVFNGKSTSADSGLLDLFCVHEEPPVLTGRVDLNTQNIAVLQSFLSQTIADVEGTAYFTSTRTGTTNSAWTPMSSNAVTTIAGQLKAFTATTPLVNKDQLVTQFGPTLAAAAFGSTDEQNVKACREAFIRTLADVGQTRTWNLMIDLIAQAGRYPPNATSLDQFMVEGEKRYWLHIAIDRFTGKIIDQKLERVVQ